MQSQILVAQWGVTLKPYTDAVSEAVFGVTSLTHVSPIRTYNDLSSHPIDIFLCEKGANFIAPTFEESSPITRPEINSAMYKMHHDLSD